MEKIKVTNRWLNNLRVGDAAKYADQDQKALQIWVGKTDISFYFVLKYHGKQFHQCIGKYPDMQLQEARTEVLNRLGKLANHGSIEAPTPRMHPLIGDAIDSFCQSFANNKTRINYISYLRVFDEIRSRKIQDVTHEEIIKFHKSMADHPVMANHAVKALATAISRLYKALGITNYNNPARDITLYKEYPRKRFLNDNEAPALLEKLREISKKPLYQDQAEALLLMIYTGQRKSRVLGIRGDQIDTEFRCWNVPGNDIKRPVQHALNDFAWEIVERRIKTRGNGFLFLWRGKPMSDCRKTFLTVCRMCGIEELHIHDLRRSLGSWMLSSGATIEEVSKILGHSSILITEQVYAHLLQNKGREATTAAINAMRKGKI